MSCVGLKKLDPFNIHFGGGAEMMEFLIDCHKSFTLSIAIE